MTTHDRHLLTKAHAVIGAVLTAACGVLSIATGQPQPVVGAVISTALAVGLSATLIHLFDPPSKDTTP